MNFLKPKTNFNNKLNQALSATNDKTTHIISKEEKFNGVYQIYCTKNNKSYIGSSLDIDRRIKNHKLHLEKGCHINRKLQKDYDLYGKEAFEYIVLEKNVDQELLTAYEKYWMYVKDAIVMYKGYNEKMPTLNHKNFQYVCEEKRNNNK